MPKDQPKMRWFDIYAPLQGFQWRGDEFEIAPGLLLNHFDKKPDLRDLDSTLGKDEQEKLSRASHWLTFSWSDGSDLLPAEVVNLVLFALWLVRPSKTYVAYRFQLGQGEMATNKCRDRLLDRFHWVQGSTDDWFENSDLLKVSFFYKGARSICCARGRLNNALLLTLAGCWSIEWLVALICHAAAAETILTYDTGHGITRRLAMSYACLVEEQSVKRDVEYNKFHTLYSKRSDIVHGRTHQIPKSDRLNTLVDFENVNRKLWRIVLSMPNMIANLEGLDEERRKYFLKVQDGYSSPLTPNQAPPT